MEIPATTQQPLTQGRVVLIGIGSNQGPSQQIAQQAISQLAALSEFVQPGSFRHSRLWLTTPVDCPPDSGDFVNAAAGFVARQEASPEALLSTLKAMERTFGRGRAWVKNAPRELDLDLLVFGDERRDDEHFVLPHPRATQRKFVLVPAAEIAPRYVWPGATQTIEELLTQLQTDEEVSPIN